MSQQCACNTKKANFKPMLHQGCSQQVKGNDPSPLLSTSETILGVLCLLLSSPEEQDRHEYIKNSPTKGYEKYGEAGVCLICLKVERLSSLEQIRHISVYKCLKGRSKEDRTQVIPNAPGHRTRVNGHKLQHRGFTQDIRKLFSRDPFQPETLFYFVIHPLRPNKQA